MSLTQQQMQALAAMGIPYNPQQAAPSQSPAPLQVTLGQSQQTGQIPFNAVANPNQFAQPFMPQAPQPTQPQQQQRPAQQQPNVLQQTIPQDPNIPQALWGRPVQDVVNALVRTSQQRQAAGVQPTPQANPAAQQQHIMQNTQPQQPVQTPAGMTMEAIQQTIQQTLMQQQLPQLILQMEQTVAQQNQAYNNPQIRARVQQIMGELPPEQQAQRPMWDYAVTLAVGEMVQKGEMQGFMPATRPAEQAWRPQGQQQPQPAMTMPQGAYVPPTPGFAEAPTGNSVVFGQRPPLTVQEGQLAQNFGLDPAKVAEFNATAFGGN